MNIVTNKSEFLTGFINLSDDGNCSLYLDTQRIFLIKKVFFSVPLY